MFTLKFRVTSITPRGLIFGKCDKGRKAVRAYNGVLRGLKREHCALGHRGQ